MVTTNEGFSKGGRGRPRSAVTRDAIISATFELLDEIGYEKLTIEGIAARAGVGKASIYRWWPNKGALAVDSFLTAVAPGIAFDSKGSARTAIANQAQRLAKLYTGRVGKFVREIIASGQFDPQILDLFYTGYLKPRRDAAKAALQRGVDRGEFREGLDFEAVIDALYGPIFHRLLIAHAENNQAFITFLAKVVLDGISTETRGSAGSKHKS